MRLVEYQNHTDSEYMQWSRNIIRYVQRSRKGKYMRLSRKKYYRSGAESERTYNGAIRESTSSGARNMSMYEYSTV